MQGAKDLRPVNAVAYINVHGGMLKTSQYFATLVQEHSANSNLGVARLELYLDM